MSFSIRERSQLYGARCSTRPPASRGERPLPDTVCVFLMESERRVLLHCQKMLSRDNLPADERQRLLGLAIAAEQEISGWPT